MCKCGCDQEALRVRANQEVAVRQFEALILAAKAGDLRNRSEKPEVGYRLIDIIGAPMRAGKESC